MGPRGTRREGRGVDDTARHLEPRASSHPWPGSLARAPDPKVQPGPQTQAKSKKPSTDPKPDPEPRKRPQAEPEAGPTKTEFCLKRTAKKQTQKLSPDRASNRIRNVPGPRKHTPTHKIAATLTNHIYFEARIQKRTRKPGLDVDKCANSFYHNMP